MRPIEMPLELAFNKTAVDATMQELYDHGQYEKLLKIAQLCNQEWHQETALKRWAIREAAENLTQGVNCKKD